ncbi:MAG: pilus assembly protein PilM [Candidatus Eisenbacteria bacterium]|nr:pilus assembly protein PilM [Candidatus Eisenbacteria bacterium]
MISAIGRSLGVTGSVRTGIDLGTSGIKLVRGSGSPRLEQVTHLGVQDWVGGGSAPDVEAAAAALQQLLGRLGLGRGQLGHLAVAIGGQEASLREVVLPPLTDAELRQTLPYAARQHLDLEGMTSPVLDAQILGPAPPNQPGGPAQTRALLVAAPALQRDFPVRVLARVGLVPEVVDLEPLAGLNALLGCAKMKPGNDDAVALLDLGARRAALHVSGSSGGLLSRVVGEGVGPRREPAEVRTFAAELASQVKETLVFYRGRFRREVGGVYLSGGGASLPGLADLLARGLGECPVSILDPLAGLTRAAGVMENGEGISARFATACGLCRWWDGQLV